MANAIARGQPANECSKENSCSAFKKFNVISVLLLIFLIILQLFQPAMSAEIFRLSKPVSLSLSKISGEIQTLASSQKLKKDKSLMVTSKQAAIFGIHPICAYDRCAAPLGPTLARDKPLTTAACNHRPYGMVALPAATVVQDFSFVRRWTLERQFLKLQDYQLPSSGSAAVSLDKTFVATFSPDGVVGVWQFVRGLASQKLVMEVMWPVITEAQGTAARAGPTYRKRKYRSTIKLPLEFPWNLFQKFLASKHPVEQVLVVYEISVSPGKFHPSSLQFDRCGRIYIIENEYNPFSRKLIGTFTIHPCSLKPLVDSRLR